MIHMQIMITTTRVPHLPAVIAISHGHITRRDVEQMYADTTRLLADAEGRYYRISDVRNMKTDFRDFMEILLSMGIDGPFRSGDPQLKIVFVGSNPWIFNMFSVLSRKGLAPKIFKTMDEALAYVKADWDAYTAQSRVVD
jgi:hypothetical protein